MEYVIKLKTKDSEKVLETHKNPITATKRFNILKKVYRKKYAVIMEVNKTI